VSAAKPRTDSIDLAPKRRPAASNGDADAFAALALAHARAAEAIALVRRDNTTALSYAALVRAIDDLAELGGQHATVANKLADTLRSSLGCSTVFDVVAKIRDAARDVGGPREQAWTAARELDSLARVPVLSANQSAVVHRAASAVKGTNARWFEVVSALEAAGDGPLAGLALAVEWARRFDESSRSVEARATLARLPLPGSPPVDMDGALQTVHFAAWSTAVAAWKTSNGRARNAALKDLCRELSVTLPSSFAADLRNRKSKRNARRRH
jgi:hypothetical protein